MHDTSVQTNNATQQHRTMSEHSLRRRVIANHDVQSRRDGTQRRLKGKILETDPVEEDIGCPLESQPM